MSDVSQVVNYFALSNEGFQTTAGGIVASGATTVPLTSTAGLTNGSVFVGIIEPGVVGKQQVFTGTVNTGTSQITGVKWTRGANTSHAAGVTIVDYVTGTAWNMLATGLLKEHTQTGTHNAVTAISLSASNGLTVSGGPVSLPAGSLSPAGLAGGNSTMLSAWQSWTPTWTNLTVGNGTVVAKYTQIGKTIHGYIGFAMGSTSVISGAPTFSVPVNFSATVPSLFAGGNVYFEDAGLTAWFGFLRRNNTLHTFEVLSGNVAGTSLANGGLSSTVPFTWGTGDFFNCNFTYEAA